MAVEDKRRRYRGWNAGHAVREWRGRLIDTEDLEEMRRNPVRTPKAAGWASSTVTVQNCKTHWGPRSVKGGTQHQLQAKQEAEAKKVRIQEESEA